jgi:hypothetical protein
MDTEQVMVTRLTLLGQVEPEWGSLTMVHGQEGLCSWTERSVETLGVYDVLLMMGGPLRRSLKVGTMF